MPVSLGSNDLWLNLTLIGDGEGEYDPHWIGVYGTVRFTVEIEEI